MFAFGFFLYRWIVGGGGTSPPPEPETFRILDEDGNRILDEDGNYINWD